MAAIPDDEAIGSPISADRVPFDYIKAGDFRSIRTDGAIGAVTPNGHIHMALYSERPAIPRRIVFKHNTDGTVGEELAEERVSRNSIVREMSVDVFMPPAVAVAIRDWLTQKIGELEKLIGSAPEDK